MAHRVAGEMYYEIDGQLLEIKRQLRQSSGYPYNPHQLKAALQDIIEGRFGQVAAPAAVTPCCEASSIINPLNFDPVAVFGSGWKYSSKKGDTDKRSLALPEVDVAKLLFETCLKEGETSIIGEEKLKRLIKSGNIRLDSRFGAALFQEEGHLILERLCKERNITYLDFPGQVLVSPYGDRYILYLCRHGGRWYRSANWLGCSWYGRHFSVGLAS